MSDHFPVGIVHGALSRHGIDVGEHYIHAIARDLWMGSIPGLSFDEALKGAHERRDRNRRRAELLAEVLSLYPDPEEIPERDGLSNEHTELSNAWLKETLRRLADLRDAEHCGAGVALSPIPRKRPTSSRNASAGSIYETLRTFDIDRWKCCAIIAQMMSEFGSDERPVEKIQKSLWDKLSRE